METASAQSPLKHSVAYFGYLQHLYGWNVAYDVETGKNNFEHLTKKFKVGQFYPSKL